MSFHNDVSRSDAPVCPMHQVEAANADQVVTLEADDELVLPRHKRVFAQYRTSDCGARELHVHCGEKEITFDEPELFAFGEGLAQHARFVAGTATDWGEGYTWDRIRELLSQLIDEGVLVRAQDAEVLP